MLATVNLRLSASLGTVGFVGHDPVSDIVILCALVSLYALHWKHYHRCQMRATTYHVRCVKWALYHCFM